MAIAFIAFGILVGTTAAGLTLMTGGSLLLAVLAYGGFGTLGAMLPIAALLLRQPTALQDDWSDDTKSSAAFSA